MSEKKATAELTDGEIVGLQESGAGGDHGGPPRRAKAFWPSAKRLLGLFRTERLGLVLVFGMVLVAVVLNVWAPHVLGKAMDAIFGGLISGQMPAGTSREQVIAGMRAQGQDQAAEMLSGMDFVPGQGIDFEHLGRLILIVLAMYVVAQTFMWLQGRVLNDLVMRIVYLLRQDIEAKLNRLPLSHFDTRQRGDLISRTTNDVDNVQQAMQQAFSSLFLSVLTVIGIVGMMFWLSWQLALIALIALPVAGVVVGVIGKRSQQLFTAQWRETGRLNGHIEESFTGHELVTVFGRQEDMADRFDERNEAMYEASFKAQFFSGMIMPIMQWVNWLGYVGIAVVGGLRVANGQMTLGAVTAFIQYSREFNQPLGQVAGMANMLISGVASAERIFELLDEPEETEDALHADPSGQAGGQGEAGAVVGKPVEVQAGGDRLTNDSGVERDGFPNESTAERDGFPNESTAERDGFPNESTVERDGFPNESTAERDGFPNESTAERDGFPNESGEGVSGRVEFEHVAFSYTPQKPLIRDLNLVAEPGQTVAIVGPTGAGKTTLVNLLMRFYDVDGGRILLDGQDIAGMPRRQLRARTGMVLQDAVLFGGTIRENIRYGRLDATDDEVLEAAKATYVDRFVHTLPDGYDTVIEQDAANVSAGERQLITIARAFLAQPDLLILDEATSSVDTRTEVLVQEAMAALRSNRTSFVIAHRLSTIRDADVILVMEHGDIVEQGSHEQLLAAGGAYARLYRSQFQGAAVDGADGADGVS
ncbi:Lipid A export ATP-binding/permease protein MsbA [Micrococcus lylae]|uniref:Fatty acid ABC transporter ATP-binding/permease protein n=1 Tax=Micrococcus lylae TaxID=1273 RepID=A0A1R4JV78_9MICC|nr:ABC transporter ATP-binding protein [Micrococcus lylae]SJN36161.1 Lipid A export ATP-binding/permease protein MsbA [Micrococcus lylae]